jgi:hypothetical protein
MRLPTERIRELGTRLAGVPAWLVQLVRGGTLPKWVIPTVGTLSLLAVLVPGFARHEPGDENADTGAASQRLEDSARTDSHAAPLEYAALDSDSDRYAGGLEEPWAEGAPDAVGEESTPTLACIIEPNQVVEIGSPITGLIEAIPVGPGPGHARVPRGEGRRRAGAQARRHGRRREGGQGPTPAG